MKLTRIRLDKYLVWLVWISLLFSPLLFFTNVIAAPPLDELGQGEIRLSEQDDGRQVELNEDQVLVISLESNPSTGYTWLVEKTDRGDEQILRQRGESEFESEPSLLEARPLLGAPVQQVLRFEAAKAGQTNLKLVYRRSWEKEVAPAKTFSVQVQAAQPFRPKSIDTASVTPTAIPLPENPIADADLTLLSLPSAYNWCDLGKCTPVKDQESCGSCWTFGTVGPLESNIKIKDEPEQDLSEQYLLSCNTDGWSCKGGWWAHDYHLNQIPPGESDAGAVYEADFPYTARDDACNPSHPHHEKIISWAYVGSEYGTPSVTAIKQAISDHGPVSVAVCVGTAFQNYSGGVFQTDESASCGSGMANHAVVLVGWDDSQGTWRLRNSWGSGWGEGGYMNIKYGTSNIGYSANYIVYEGGCQDAYEADNDSSNAKSITVNGAAQTHNFHAAGDVDWIKFTTSGGSVYTMTTSNLDAGNNTSLALYDTDATTMLASNDDCPGQGQASCINNWTAPLTGTYFITVSNASSAGDCTAYGYNLAVASNVSQKINAVYLPLLLKGSACEDAQLVQNSGFESGDTIWVQASGWYDIIGYAWQGYYPHSGYWSAWFGGYDDADDRLYQTLSVPAGASSVQLTFYLYVYTTDSLFIPYDYFYLELQNASGGTLESFEVADNTDAGGWYVGTVTWYNFSAHAGQTRRIFFQGANDFSDYTNFYLDDVTFWTYCGGLTQAGQDTGQGELSLRKIKAPPGFTLDRAASPKGQ